MSRKDYQAIAQAVTYTRRLSKNHNFSAEEALDIIVLELGHVLAQDNSRFDYERFSKACQTEER